MYRIAVCEDDPRTTKQNKTAACRVLDGKGRAQGRDYEIDVFHTAPPPWAGGKSTLREVAVCFGI